MSMNGSQRREQRRRMVVSWKRSATTEMQPPEPESKPLTEYGPDAHPERQRGPAVLLPVGFGGMVLTTLVILVPMLAAVAVAASEAVFATRLFTPGGRFARTIGAAAACFDPRLMTSLAGWLAQLDLLIAAGVAVIVRGMRRHRRDDYQGRYRAWGWMAGLFLITACAGMVPLGRLCGAAVADASGIVLGPDGSGWWVVLAATAFVLVSLWAVLPLHERGGTAFWLLAAAAGWSAAAACGWLWTGSALAAIAGHAAWSLAAACAAVAMLAAARSVLREVKGLARRSAAKPRTKTAARSGRDGDVAPAAADDNADDVIFEEQPAEDAGAEGDETDDTAYVDGSEQDTRHLSKAERKRLKRLARMNRSVA
jgi:hypothetical protein